MNKIEEKADFEKMFSLGRGIFKSKNYSSAKTILEKCLLIPETQNDNIKMMDVKLYLAYTNIYLLNYQLAVNNLSKALEICELHLNEGRNTEKFSFSK